MRVIMIALMVFVLPGPALAWWNDSWPYRLPITLDTSSTGAAVNESLAEVPVLLRLHSGNFPDFFLLNENLSDLRFVAGDDKTPLTHHIEQFDLVNQLMFVWVKVPQLTGGINTEKIWMYYGNPEAVNNAESGGTYDVAQVAVHHFEEIQGLPLDETAYANNIQDMSAVPNPASLIGAGVTLAEGSALTLPDSPSLRLLPANGMTFSAWLKTSGVQQDGYLIYRTDGVNTLILGVDQSALYARLSNDSQVFETPRTAPLTPDVWQHVGLTVTQNSLSVFVNGTELASIQAEVPEIAGPIYIGASVEGTNYITGELDELQVSNKARSGSWLQLAAKNQGPQDLLLRANEAEQLGNAGGSSYMVVILKNMTHDGWVVIFLLFIMAIISWVVMVAKGLYLRRIQEDNRAFMQKYAELGNSDPALLDHEEDEEEKELEGSPITQAIFGKHDHFQSSPIYHLYHKGLKEVRFRIGTAVGAQASSLTPQAVETIRASMDAFLVREIQKLNAQMVLLTIAISGGPFLGLLGTVVGVMITFAAIAASGDVNIATIAPGMAAALLATVAGLAVAIPALFGYNYLGARIKDVIADMRVFVDEFVTKIAEYYG